MLVSKIFYILIKIIVNFFNKYIFKAKYLSIYNDIVGKYTRRKATIFKKSSISCGYYLCRKWRNNYYLHRASDYNCTGFYTHTSFKGILIFISSQPSMCAFCGILFASIFSSGAENLLFDAFFIDYIPMKFIW